MTAGNTISLQIKSNINFFLERKKINISCVFV